MSLRINQGATSTLAVVSLLMSMAALAGVVYMVWINPTNVRLNTEAIKAQTKHTEAQNALADRFAEMAVQLKRSQDWWDVQTKRMEEMKTRGQ